MFKFLKEKLKQATDFFAKKIDEKGETVEQTVEQTINPTIEPTIEQTVDQTINPTIEQTVEQTGKVATPDVPVVNRKPKQSKKKQAVDIQKETKAQIAPDEVVCVQTKSEKGKSLFSQITQFVTKKKLSLDQFEEIFFDLELMLLESNLAVEVIERIKENLKRALVDTAIDRGKIEQTILQTLATSINDLFVPTIDLIKSSEQKKPFVIMFVGVNGAGKTTTLAKIAHYFQKNNKSCVIGACDTFRAAAIQQLEFHAQKLGIKLIKHDYGADAAAVAYDAIKHAQAKKLDCVLIDTAGRLHSNSNLMEELAKIRRVAHPDLTIFVGESITGNDCVEQARQFDQMIGIDAIILSKADVDEKGGAAVSVSYVVGKPILFMGNGQQYDDLQEFSRKAVLQSLGLAVDISKL